MKPVSPHDLLSAYLDGELSPREREDVERLLAESKEARQELSELEQVGELLRQIPREALPSTFASQVLDVCLSETGEFDSTTLSDLPAPGNQTPDSAPTSQTKRRIRFRTAGLTAALATLAAILIIVFPGSPETNHSEMAHHPSADQSAEAERNFSEDHSADLQDQPLASEGAEPDDAHNEAGVPQDVGFAEAQSLKKRPSQESSDQAKTLATPAEADAVRQSGEVMERELSIAAAEKFRKSGNQQNGRVAVVKIRVPDRQQGLKELQSLLERHEIPTGASSNGQASKDGENQLAVYVEADSDRFSAAMDDLKKQSTFRDVTWDSPVAMAQIQPMLSAPKKGFGTFRRSRAMSFGGAGAAAPKNSRIEAAEKDPASPLQLHAEKSASRQKSPGKPGEKKPDEADKADDRSPSSPPAVKAEPVPTPEAAEAKPKKSAAPRITAADSKGLDKRERDRAPMKRPQTDAKSAEPKGAKPANRKANESPRSRQQEFTLPQPVLKRLQDSAAEIRSRQNQSDESKQASPTPNRGRVQVVFVLVDQKESSENAPPADKSAPDSE